MYRKDSCLFKTLGNIPECKLIFIICRRDGNETTEASLSIFGLTPSISVDLLSIWILVRLMSGTLKCIFSGFLEFMNSFSTSALRSLKGRLSFSQSVTDFCKIQIHLIDTVGQTVQLRELYLRDISR